MPLKKRSLRSVMQDANRASLDVPASVPTPEVDLHSPDPENGRVHVDPNAETRVISYGEPHMRTMTVDEQFPYSAGDDKLVDFSWPHHEDETPTKVFTEQDLARATPRKRLTDAEARAQVERIEKSTPMKETSLRSAAEQAPAFKKTIAEELSEIKPGPAPSGPLPGQGSKAIEVPPESELPPLPAPKAKLASSGNMVSASPSVKYVGGDSSTMAQKTPRPIDVEASMLGERTTATNPMSEDTGRLRAAAERAKSATSVDATPSESTVGSAAGEAIRREGLDTLGRFANALGRQAYGEAAMETLGAGSRLAMTPFRALAAPAIKMAGDIATRNAAVRAAAESNVGKSLLKRVASASWNRGVANIGNVGSGLEAATSYGGMALKGLGEGASLAFIARKGQESTAARTGVAPAYREALAEQQRQGAKYGYDVTSPRSGYSDAGLQLKALVGGDPKISVTENPSLKARFEAENRKRIRKLIASGSIHPIAVGRPTITGTSE